MRPTIALQQAPTQLLSRTLPSLAVTPEISDLLAANAPVALGVSGGKPMVIHFLTTHSPVAWIVLGGTEK